jgi:HK97 family phage major capsid protein
MARLLQVLEARQGALETEENEIIAAAEGAGGFTDEQRERLQELRAEYGTVGADITGERARMERTRREPSAAGDVREGPITPLGAFPGDFDPRPYGQRFTEDEGWAEYVGRVAPHGFSANARIESPKIDMGAGFVPSRRPQAAIITSGSSSGGALSIPAESGIFDPATFQRELTVRDVIRTGTTDSDSVEYVRVLAFSNAAAAVAEADSIDPTDTTGLKPESTLTFQRVLDTVRTIAHWLPATTRALQDAGQLRTIIDQFLRYGLAEELEDQIVSGNGQGENFKGILEYDGEGLQEQGWDTDILTTTRKARTLVRTVGKARANAYMFHPNDWEVIDLELSLGGGGTNNRQAGEMSPPRLWGLPVIESEGVPEGTGLVGDFRQAVLWDRMQTTIQASSGVENFFLKNMVAILAELRAAFGVIRPQAFVAIDTEAAGS